MNYYKNHKVASVVLFVFIVYVGAASLISAIEQNMKPVKWVLSKLLNHKEKYTVKLVIPSSMSDAEVKIDNEIANVLERSPNFIKISVHKSAQTKVFNIENSHGDICTKSQEIQTDNSEIIFNC